MRILRALFLLQLLITTEIFCSENPNIIIIYTDDQGYGDASWLNAKAKFNTPHIDRLCREGITLTDGHSSDTVCTPSRYGLLTGRYSWRTHLKRGVFGAEHPCLIEKSENFIVNLTLFTGLASIHLGWVCIGHAST